MKYAAGWKKSVLAVILVAAVCGGVSSVRAADLPVAAASPLTGVAFDDKPLMLPLQRNFQMAMLTAGSELGRTCGPIEAYGWRMSQTEQGRVNQIFNNTVDRLRLVGYTITPQTLSSVSSDITLFTADRADRHFLFLWSAGELGLVLNLCETSSPVPVSHQAKSASGSVQVFPVPMDEVSLPAKLRAPGKLGPQSLVSNEFSPTGEWVGGYTCAQGFTGGTLQIDHLRGKDFDGVFKFYPTSKNPSVPAGSYAVYGQYDRESHRILINPGKWINHPHNFYNTVIVGSFDPINSTFSAFFQGISGCTSFEAKRGTDTAAHDAKKTKAVKKHPKKKKPVSRPVSQKKLDNLLPLSQMSATPPVGTASDTPPPPSTALSGSVDKRDVSGIVLAAPPPK
jgi:hypothetical protein